MAVVVLIWLKQDFCRVFPKKIGEIVNFCRNNQLISLFTLFGDMFMCFFQRKCVWGLFVKQLRHTLNIYCSYLQLINVRYWIFRHSFSKHLAFSYFLSDSIENLYTGWNHIEVVWCEVSSGFTTLIKIYDRLKVVPFFLHHPIFSVVLGRKDAGRIRVNR